MNAPVNRATVEQSGKDTRTMLRVGAIGALITALCCFTPALVVLLGIVGLSALTDTLDLVLLPALAFFVGLTVYALVKRTGK